MAYTILMDNNKHLTATITSILYQGENYCDSFYFLIPLKYKEVDLSDFLVTVMYTNANGDSFLDILEPDEEIYKENYLKFSLPVTTKITKCSGEVRISLTLNKFDKDTMTQFTIHTNETVITINPIADYYKFDSDNSLNALDQRIGKLDARLKYMEEHKDLWDLDTDDNGTLKIKYNDVFVGNGVDVVLPSHSLFDVDDGNNDGIQDLDEIYRRIEL